MKLFETAGRLRFNDRSETEKNRAEFLQPTEDCLLGLLDWMITDSIKKMSCYEDLSHVISSIL